MHDHNYDEVFIQLFGLCSLVILNFRYLHDDGNEATPTLYYGTAGNTPLPGTHSVPYTPHMQWSIST